MLVRSAIFNKARKSFGNTTAVNWVDNQTIIKSKISNPTNPNTPAQQLRRSIFQSLQAFASSALPLIQERFSPTAANRSPYSSAMRAMLLEYTGVSQYSPQVFADVKPAPITNGPLQPIIYGLSDLTVEQTGTSGPFDELVLTLEFSSQVWWPNSSSEDQVSLALINPDANYFEVQNSTVERNAGEIQVQRVALTGERLFLVAFVRNSLGEVSAQSALMIRNDAGDWAPGITVV